VTRSRIQPPPTDTDDLAREQAMRLRGRPLISRGVFLARRSILVLLYLVAVAAALLGLLMLEGLFLQGIGVTILAILAAIAFEMFADGVFEVHKAFDYAEYRREWELANDPVERTGVRES
jgi:hypothetical protein